MTPQEKRRRHEQTRALLVAAFPQCFADKGQVKRPLKIGIFDDMRKLGSPISLKRLRGALHDYTRGPLYLRSMVVGAERIDLDGKPAGVVGDEAAQQAADRLAAINAADARRRERKNRRMQTEPSS